MAMFAQQGHQFGLPPDGLLANDLRERWCGAPGALVWSMSERSMFWSLHKIARILHKNAATVNAAARVLVNCSP